MAEAHLASRSNSSCLMVVEIGPQIAAVRLVAKPSAHTVRVACLRSAYEHSVDGK